MKDASPFDRPLRTIPIPGVISGLCAITLLVLDVAQILGAMGYGEHHGFSLLLIGLPLAFFAGVLGFFNGLLWMAENFAWGIIGAISNALLWLAFFRFCLF